MNFGMENKTFIIRSVGIDLIDFIQLFFFVNSYLGIVESLPMYGVHYHNVKV